MKVLLLGLLFLLSITGGSYAHTKKEYHYVEHPSSRVVPSTNSLGWTTHGIPHQSSLKTHRHTHIQRKMGRTVSRKTVSLGGLVTVQTAAGIPITVAKDLVIPFTGFIKDLVDDGYTPKHIGCWAPPGTHVPNSNHYHGGACDFDQTGWNKTQPKMYRVHDLAQRWGLRDGCTFRKPDCGHIDDGRNIGLRLTARNNLITRYIKYETTPITLVPFEE